MRFLVSFHEGQVGGEGWVEQTGWAKAPRTRNVRKGADGERGANVIGLADIEDQEWREGVDGMRWLKQTDSISVLQIQYSQASGKPLLLLCHHPSLPSRLQTCLLQGSHPVFFPFSYLLPCCLPICFLPSHLRRAWYPLFCLRKTHTHIMEEREAVNLHASERASKQTRWRNGM